MTADDPLLARITDVWGEQDDLADGGFPYLAFIIQHDLADMAADDWDEEECIEEVADIIIAAVRALHAHGYDYRDIVMDRLDAHAERGIDAIAEAYRERFDDTASREYPSSIS